MIKEKPSSQTISLIFCGKSNPTLGSYNDISKKQSKTKLKTTDNLGKWERNKVKGVENSNNKFFFKRPEEGERGGRGREGEVKVKLWVWFGVCSKNRHTHLSFSSL